MAQLNGGSVKITATGAVGVSSKPVTIYSLTWLSTGTPGVAILGDGPSGATERFRATGTANAGATIAFGKTGKYFPSGAYLTVDANTTYVDVDYAMQA